MKRKYWLIGETYRKWGSEELKELHPNQKSYQFYFENKDYEFHYGDIFLGLDTEIQKIVNIGTCSTNSYFLPKKFCVHLMPRYYFKRKLSFDKLHEMVFDPSEFIEQLNKNSFVEIPNSVFLDYLEIIQNFDFLGHKLVKNLDHWVEQRKYLSQMLEIFDENECDVQEIQEVFLILRNFLNWNPEFMDGKDELEELMTFLKYSLHIEDLSFQQRSEILDKLIFYWVKYVNLLPKKQIKDLQNIKVPFLL